MWLAEARFISSSGGVRKRPRGKSAASAECHFGDGELQEGQVWQAAKYAASDRLDNLCLVVI